jgi:hypothetical protein
MVKHNCQIVNFCFENDVFFIADENVTLTRFDSKSLQTCAISMDLLANYPKIAQEYKPFDMGYSYVMKCHKGVVAIITDLGLLIIQTF